jgi:hypothetical protein
VNEVIDWRSHRSGGSQVTLLNEKKAAFGEKDASRAI